MTVQIRTLTDDDLAGWLAAVKTGFLEGPEASPEEVEMRRGGIDLDRTQGAWDRGRFVGTFRTTPQQMTVPGGAALPASAVTNVTVSPTHRRRGLLTRMMGNALRAAKDRGDAFSTLIAAEYPIYGRFGYGPATWVTAWEVDVPRAGLDPRHAGPPAGEGRIDLVDLAEARRVGPAFHDRFRAGPERQGAIDRTERWWQRATGELRYPGDDFKKPFVAVYRDADDEVQGMVAYTVKSDWHDKRPHEKARVLSLTATTAAAERHLWQFVLSIDWVTSVDTGPLAPDDLLPHLLPDPRAARVLYHADLLWLRPLDVPRMLQTRSYPTAGTLVLDVVDEAGLAGGRYRLEAGPDGATCTPTTDRPDLTLPVGELGRLYLGDEAASRLVTLGRVTEGRAGASRTADLLLRTARRPWCQDGF
jgi:predicted acetyltransferase